MNQAAISADIVSFTALSEKDRKELWGIMKAELKGLEKIYHNDIILGKRVSL